ncbi:hypothetical protein L2E82_07675 [Cichorium intybus]|uniref:Uncharacterized protein n=1 Tax=Cichorium intybus TaxID=13427 RepID=A0ACB9G4P0_CICIN|nr:hypothetical protein L2E82_07675 [Cichorium intybus]
MSLSDENVYRGLAQPDEIDDNEKSPSFTSFGHGQGISNNQDWNSSREYADNGQPLSRSALARIGHSNPSRGGNFYAGDASPGISDVDRRGTSETGPRGSSSEATTLIIVELVVLNPELVFLQLKWQQQECFK